MGKLIRTLLAAAVLAAPLAAREAEEEPEAVVRAFHAALAGGDGDAALALLTPDAVIFESGGAEMSRDEYRHHHLGPDMEFSRATERQVVDQQADASGDAAWVLTRSRTTGAFRERQLASAGVETMLLVRTADGWRIRHIHWSSRKLGGGH